MQKTFCFSVCRKQSSFSLPFFPEFQRAGSNSCSSGKGGVAEKREEQSRNNTAALGQGPGSMSRGTQNNISELFCRAKPPAGGYSRIQTYTSRGSLGSRVRAVLDVMIFAFLLFFFPLQCISTKSSICFCYLNYFPPNKITSHCVSDGGKREHTATHSCTKSGSLNTGTLHSLWCQSPNSKSQSKH